jgi:RNA polymerase sigma factor (sigma-70 family)
MSAIPVSAPPAPTTGSRYASTDDTAELVRAAARADAGAWKAIIDRYTGTVHRIARAHRLGDADAADVAQTVWLRLIQHIGRLREPERVGGWVATTARNECLRLCRQRGRVTLVDDAALFDAMRPEPEPPAPAVENEGRAAVLHDAVDSLPPRQRAIVDLLMADPPVSYGDIATGLDIPIGSIGPTRQRSLRSLRLRCDTAGVVPG